MPVRSSGSAARTGADSSARGEMFSARKVPSGRPGTANAARSASASSSSPSPTRCACANHSSGPRRGSRSNRASASKPPARPVASSTTGWKTIEIAPTPSSSSAATSLRCSASGPDGAAHVAHGLAAAGALRPVQRGVGVLEQHRGVDAVGRGGGHARGRGQRTAAHGQLGQRGTSALGAVLGGLGRRRPAGSARTPRHRGDRPCRRRAPPSAAARRSRPARGRPRRGRARR